MTVVEYSGEYKTAAAYAQAVRTWMNQMYHFQCVSASFPYYFASLQAQAAAHTTATASETRSFEPQTTTTTAPSQVPTSTTPPTTTTTTTTNREPNRGGLVYKIPSIWKRFVAEMIDFILLFMFKLLITYAVVDTFDLFDGIENYDFENLRTDILTDYRLALNMTSELLILELFHRIGTCMYEALCLYSGTRGTIGGATPGKKLLGLRVVRCEWMAPVLNQQAIVFPATNLGLTRSIIRSVVKNFSLTFLFPICITLFTFQHNRTIYDLLAGSVVVEVRTSNNNNN